MKLALLASGNGTNVEALLKQKTNHLELIKNFMDRVIKFTKLCLEENLFGNDSIIISAGGSDYFDIVLEKFKKFSNKKVIKLLRSGCYLTHDSLRYYSSFKDIIKRNNKIKNISPGLKPALQVWGIIQSLPEKGLAIVNVGKRDISYDLDFPKPEFLFSPEIDKKPKKITNFFVTNLNDQHAYLSVPEKNNLRVGDFIAFGISHPCTTFDKWKIIFLVNNNYEVVDAIRTYLS